MNEIQKQVANIQRAAQTDPRFKQADHVEVTQAAKEFTNRLFKSLLPHFPAWRQSCPEPEDLGRLKNAWTKAIMRHELKTSKKLNVKAGLLACEESDSDWMPSVGKFIKMCEQSNDLTQFADRAYNLFIKREQQIDTVGRMVTASHSFELRQMKAAYCKKGFIELYLQYAANNAIEQLEAYALTETVQLSDEQQKDADNRAKAAQNDFLAEFSGLITEKPKEKVKPVKPGLVTGKIKTPYKSPSQLEKEKERQLNAIKGKL